MITSFIMHYPDEKEPGKMGMQSNSAISATVTRHSL